MKKDNEPVNYLDAIQQLRREEQDERNQIHSPNIFPQEEAVIDYTQVSKAWDKALQHRDIINMPPEKK